MTIKILGSGCKNCNTLESNVGEVISEMGLNITIEKVTDFADIATYGVMQTPALVFDEKVLSYGKVLKPAEIKKLLTKIIGVN